MPAVTNSVWTEESLRGRAKELGYWVVKVIAHRHDYWFLVKSRSPEQPIFCGKEGRDFIALGALGSADAVSAGIAVLKAQKAAAEDDDE